MASVAPPLDQLYKLTRDRLEVVLDGETLTDIGELEAWTQVCEDLSVLDPERNPKRLMASVYRLTQQLVLAADGTPPSDVTALARLSAAARRTQRLMLLLDT